MAQALNLDALYCAAVLTLAELWLGCSTSQATCAQDLLQASLPQILAQGSLELRGRCHLALAKCQLAGFNPQSGRSGVAWMPLFILPALSSPIYHSTEDSNDFPSISHACLTRAYCRMRLVPSTLNVTASERS